MGGGQPPLPSRSAAIPRAPTLLHRQLDVVTDELRRRVGATFTLAELADAYDGAERWLRGAVEERAPVARLGPDARRSRDAAFHAYSRGALDYAP